MNYSEIALNIVSKEFASKKDKAGKPYIDHLKSSFCSHEYLWVRNVYGDEIYMTGKWKRSWWKCNKCGKWQSRDYLNTNGRS